MGFYVSNYIYKQLINMINKHVYEPVSYYSIYDQWDSIKLPSGNFCYSSLLNMAHFEIVDLPNFKMVDLSIVIYVNVYQRVNHFHPIAKSPMELWSPLASKA